MRNKFELLYNPFNKIAGWKAFFVGLVIVYATVVIGYYSSVYYPGALDAKLGLGISLADAFFLQFIGLGSLIFSFYIGALIFAKGVRFQDIAGTITFARYPYLLISVLGFLVNKENLAEINNILRTGNISELSQLLSNAIGLLVVALLMIPLVVWFIALLYNAFRVSTGLKGSKCVFVFVGTVIIAEIMSIIPLILYWKKM